MFHTWPFVSVIVPVLNGERTLEDCLASLVRVEYPATRREILVIDNGSHDRTPEIARKFPVRYLQERHPGAAAARNQGIRSSRGEILAFTDADCVATASWLHELVRGFEDEKVAGVEGHLVPYPPATPAERYAARLKSHSRAQRLMTSLPHYLVTADVAFHRKVFERIGLFDSRFPSAGGEDIDLSWRFFQEPDFHHSYAPRAVVFHRHRSTAWGLFTQQIAYGHGQALLARKYRQKHLWSMRREATAYGCLARAVTSVIRRTCRRLFAGSENAGLADASFDCLAMLGRRIGFTRGLLSMAFAKHPWFRI